MNFSKCNYLFFLSKTLCKWDLVIKSCACRNYCVLSNNKIVVPEDGLLYPKPLKYFNNYLSSNNVGKCWSCGNSVSTLFCKNCKSLQRVNKNSNFFQLLELDYSYDIKLSDLTKNYRKLQSVLHPDRFGNKSEEEKVISEEYSSLVNKAYSTLSHPIERGLYILKLKGATIEEGTTQLESEFLMDIMERNEEVEEEKDGTKLAEYNIMNKESMAVLIKELLAAFEKDDIPMAKNVLTKLKYYSSLDSKIKQRKQNLGIPD